MIKLTVPRKNIGWKLAQENNKSDEVYREWEENPNSKNYEF